jgi:aspartate/methionine/tyrosine aminotransferase
VPRRLVNGVERLIVNTTSCAPAFVQLAGLAAIEGPQDCVREMAREFQVRRDAFVAGLNQVPDYSCPLPRGAFYAFPRVSDLLRRLELTTESFAEMLLEEFGLACLPGTAFGPGGADHMRFSFANSRPVLRRTLDLLRQASPPHIARSLRDPGPPDLGAVLP